MDTKKVLQLLVKIADKQQKIINKMAQGLPPDSLPTSEVTMPNSPNRPPAAQPAPMSFHPNTHITPQQSYNAIKAAIPPNLITLLSQLQLDHASNTLNFRFKPNVTPAQKKDTFTKLTGILNQLAQQNSLQQPPNLNELA